MQTSRGALDGIRVLELGHIIGGPFCGHLFADHGAEVVKIEPAGGRGWTSQLLRWAKWTGVAAIAVEDLDFQAEKTREKHGRKKRFRQLISGIPTGRLKARLVSMAAGLGIAIVAVDPAYTSQWGAQHWKKPMAAPRRSTTRHDAGSIAIGRRALGHPILLGVPPAEGWGRTAPPRAHQSDVHGLRTAQAGPGDRGREETRRPVTDSGQEPPARTGSNQGTRATSASKTVRDTRSDGQWAQDPLLLTD